MARRKADTVKDWHHQLGWATFDSVACGYTALTTAEAGPKRQRMMLEAPKPVPQRKASSSAQAKALSKAASACAAAAAPQLPPVAHTKIMLQVPARVHQPLTRARAAPRRRSWCGCCGNCSKLVWTTFAHFIPAALVLAFAVPGMGIALA